jgi:DnaJ-domain-containing protein 1
MPFSFRKSISVGGIRLTFSKSGIRYSASPTKGFRITTGEHGTNATVGSHGFYYREGLDARKVQQPGDAPPIHGDSSSDVAGFVNATSERMITEINNRKSKQRTAPIIGFGSALLSSFAFGCGSEGGSLMALIAGVIATMLAAHYDRTERTTFLHYDLGSASPNLKCFERTRICTIISESEKVWRVTGPQSTPEWKRDASAALVVGRREVGIGVTVPPFIETNVDVWGIDAGGTRLYFFPDYLFVLQNDHYEAVPYESLRAHFTAVRFMEERSVPTDANIVGRTWRYVREDGERDLRFNNNRQVSIALYGLLALKSPNRLDIHLQCSNYRRAEQAAEQIQRETRQEGQTPEERAEWERAEEEQANRQRWDQERAERKQQQDRAKQQRAKQQRAEREQPRSKAGGPESDYEILQVGMHATGQEISAAYLRMAQMYHPDKVEGLAPEYMEIAKVRMKEINDAYARLKSRQ